MAIPAQYYDFEVSNFPGTTARICAKTGECIIMPTPYSAWKQGKEGPDNEGMHNYTLYSPPTEYYRP